MPGQAGEIPKKAADGRWRWADGTEPTVQEWTAMYAQASGGPDADLSFLGGSQGAVDIGDLASGQYGTGPDADSNAEFYGVLTGTGKTGKDPYGTGVLDAAMPSIVGAQTPGAELDTALADEERKGLEALLSDLQQQATTGSGAWEGALEDATKRAQASAQALGQGQQNQTGGNYGQSLLNIGNAQAGASQRAVGQGNILREKSKMGAQDAITGVTSAMGKTAAEQAAATAAARRAVQSTNAALLKNAEESDMKKADMISTAMSAGMSDGGEVPGEPIVFGDDDINDTELAKLSPGEIVLPISVAQSPNAPEAAAAFVRALQENEAGAPQGFADGGEVDDGYNPQTGLKQLNVEDDYGSGNAALSFLAPHLGRMLGHEALRKKYLGPKAPTVESGGLLESEQYGASRDAQLGNAYLLAQRAAGQGPSVVPQMAQNTSDSNIEAAMQAQAAGQGGADLLARSTAAQQGAAGEAGMMAAGEQAAGQQGLARALADQQERDLAFSRAQQQAAWGQTMLNVGLGLDQQQMINNLLSGAAQGIAAAGDLGFGSDNGDRGEGGDDGGDEYSFGQEDLNSGPGDEPTDWGEGGDDGGDTESFGEEDGNSGGYARGGRVKKKRDEDFAEELSRGGYC